MNREQATMDKKPQPVNNPRKTPLTAAPENAKMPPEGKNSQLTAKRPLLWGWKQGADGRKKGKCEKADFFEHLAGKFYILSTRQKREKSSGRHARNSAKNLIRTLDLSPEKR